MCFYCDREVKGNPQPWWYKNYVCWTCRVQNGIKNNPMTLEIEKNNTKHRRSDFYCVFLKAIQRNNDCEDETIPENKNKNKIKENVYETGRICYRCNNPMVDVGFKFRTPKKNDVKQWKHLQETWEVQQQYINGVSTYVGPKVRTWKQNF